MNLNVSGIYQIKNIINGKIYVGQSINIKRRIYYHKCPSSGCLYIRNAIKKYGWDSFEISVLEQVDDISKLTEREQYWLNTLESFNPQKGYNICSVAQSVRGVKRSMETRIKMSVAKKGRKATSETLNKMREANLGKKLSDETKRKIGIASRNISNETRAKISAARIGRKLSDETKAKISAAGFKLKINQINITTGEIIKTWNHITEASQTLSINMSHISACCYGKRKSAGGYAWRYIGNDFKIDTDKILKRKVNQIDIATGEIIHTWNSMAEIEKTMLIHETGICACCNGRQKTAYGYIWKHVK